MDNWLKLFEPVNAGGKNISVVHFNATQAGQVYDNEWLETDIIRGEGVNVGPAPGVNIADGAPYVISPEDGRTPLVIGGAGANDITVAGRTKKSFFIVGCRNKGKAAGVAPDTEIEA